MSKIGNLQVIHEGLDGTKQHEVHGDVLKSYKFLLL